MIKKHIKRKFKLQLSVDEINNRGLEIFSLDKPFDKKNFKNKDAAFIIDDKNIATLCMIHHEAGQPIMFPVPDLTLIYFTQAQSNIKDVDKYRKELIVKSAVENIRTESSSNEFYKFYGAATAGIIFLSTAMECFTNFCIPENFKYRKINQQKKFVEEYDFEQIQRYLSTDVKLKSVLPLIFNKDFFKVSNKNTAAIESLKRLRDDIIHTKTGTPSQVSDDIIKKLLKFNYDAALQGVANYMNYYKTNYIVECDCGRDF